MRNATNKLNYSKVIKLSSSPNKYLVNDFEVKLTIIFEPTTTPRV
jgi:hypothetical protein